MSNAQTLSQMVGKAQMLKYSNAQMLKCSNAQMLKCSNAQMPKCSNARMLKCTNGQMLKRANAQMHYCQTIAVGLGLWLWLPYPNSTSNGGHRTNWDNKFVQINLILTIDCALCVCQSVALLNKKHSKWPWVPRRHWNPSAQPRIVAQRTCIVRTRDYFVDCLRHLPFAICHVPFAIYHLPFAICNLSVVICHLSFAICHLPFSICHLRLYCDSNVCFGPTHSFNVSPQGSGDVARDHRHYSVIVHEVDNRAGLVRSHLHAIRYLVHSCCKSRRSTSTNISTGTSSTCTCMSSRSRRRRRCRRQ